MTLVWSPGFTSWDPSLITTALWLDAADASTVTTVSGAVSQWNDKSGNSRNALQTTIANRPNYSSTGLNGKGLLTFDGTNDHLTYAAGVDPFTIIAVASTSTTNTYKSIAGAIKTNGAGPIDAFYLQGGDPARTATFVRGTLADSIFGSDFVSTAGVFLSGQHFIFAGLHNGSTITSRLNGTQGTTDTTASTPRNVGGGVVGAGYYNSTIVDFWPGTIAELIICSAFETSLNVQKLEGYLAHKWGLTANLPADHLYKVNPPAP
jgi:hypothetical protein